MNTVDKVISIAEEQVGYLEKASPYDLDSKTGNAGYNNYTKYARDLHDEIGSPFVDGYAWCQTFVTWCFIRAYGQSEALKLLGGWTAYCPTGVGQFKNMGEWHTSDPKKGDVIYFYDSEGDYGHVGLVYDVDSSRVYTIEGNTSATEGVVPNGGGVFKKSYSIDYYKIAGYGRPAYDEAKNGWSKAKDGSRWKYYIDGEPYKNGWLEVDGKWYYLSPNGYMITDRYIKSADYATNGLMYYIDKKGVWNNRSYRWVRDSKGWQFQGVESGHLVKGKWLNIGVSKDKKTYYVNSKGYCVIDKTVNIKGKTYTFDENGVLIGEVKTSNMKEMKNIK